MSSQEAAYARVLCKTILHPNLPMTHVPGFLTQIYLRDCDIRPFVTQVTGQQVPGAWGDD